VEVVFNTELDKQINTCYSCRSIYCSWYVTIFVVSYILQVLTIELYKLRRSLQDEVAYVSDSSFTSDDDSNPFNAWDEDGDNSTYSPSVSLEDEASGNSKDENARNILQRIGMNHGST